jgi:hypothetical protein
MRARPPPLRKYPPFGALQLAGLVDVDASPNATIGVRLGARPDCQPSPGWPG